MGAGKTTVGPQCAPRLRARLRRHRRRRRHGAGDGGRGRSSRTGGEPRFRELEREGGRRRVRVSGAARHRVRRRNRRSIPRIGAQLRAAGVVVWLRAPVPVLAGDARRRRLDAAAARGTTRPARCARLERLREPAYEAAAHASSTRTTLDVAASPTRCSARTRSTSRRGHERTCARRPRRARLRRRRRRACGHGARHPCSTGPRVGIVTQDEDPGRPPDARRAGARRRRCRARHVPDRRR